MPCPLEQARLHRPCSKHPRAAGTHRCRLAAESLQRAPALPASALGSQTCERASLGCLQGRNGTYGAAGVAPVAGTPSAALSPAYRACASTTPLLRRAPAVLGAAAPMADRVQEAICMLLALLCDQQTPGSKMPTLASPKAELSWDGVAQCPNLVARKPACKCQGSIHNCISRRSQRGALQPGCSHPAACNPCRRMSGAGLQAAASPW